MKYVHVLLLTVSLLLVTQRSSTQDYEVSVTTVNVWIRAVDRSGNPVTGLQESDFVIYEDGKKMSPSCFEEVRLSMPGLKDRDEDNPATVGSKESIPKRFILYLDLFNTTQAEMDRLRPELDAFLQRIHLKDWEVMMVAYLPSGHLGIVAPFTRSISTQRKVLDQAKGSMVRDQHIKRNEADILQILTALQIHNQDDPDEPEAGPNKSSGGSGIEQQFFQMAISSAYRQADVFARQDKQATMRAFSGLDAFGEYYGKNLSTGDHTVVMFVSGGMNSDPGRRYFELVNDYVRRTADNLDPAKFILESGSPLKENNFDIERVVKDSIGRLNRYNLTLYAMNTRGLDSSAPDITKMEGDYARIDINLIKDYQDSLSEMAEETGGTSFQNSQNFKLGFNNILDDISHQYLVCYRSPDHKKADEYHSIKVVSKTPGLKLRYRKGYVD